MVAFTASQLKAIETTKKHAETLFCGFVDKRTGEVIEQYVPQHHKNYGIFLLLFPMERYDAKMQAEWERTNGKIGKKQHYTCDAVGGTCDCYQFSNCQCCKHIIALQGLVFEGKAPGMPAEWIAEYYCPEMAPHSHLSPGMDTTTDDSDPARWADMPKADGDFYRPCSVCGQPVPRGMVCNHLTLPSLTIPVVPVTSYAREKEFAN